MYNINIRTMKKTFSLLLGLLVVCSSLFVSCGESDNEQDSSVCQITVVSEGNGKVAITNNIGSTVNVLKGNVIEVVATPDEACDFLGWFIDGNDTPVSTDAVYTFTVGKSMVLVAKFGFPFVVSGSIAGHDYVDLGLPSGMKWATYNIGATKLDEEGERYAWGETEAGGSYSWGPYKWGNGQSKLEKQSMTKYNSTDGKSVLDLDDDAAYANWGGSWRMPTVDEMNELIENCTFQGITYNGCWGLKVRGPNGNCMFLPSAGYSGSTPGMAQLRGYTCYWTSTLSSDKYSAYRFDLYMNPKNEFYTIDAIDGNDVSHRRYGYSVRAVSE